MAPLFLAATIPSTRTPTSVDFGTGILESMPYTKIEQAPYHRPAYMSIDNLVATEREMAKELT